MSSLNYMRKLTSSANTTGETVVLFQNGSREADTRLISVSDNTDVEIELDFGSTVATGGKVFRLQKTGIKEVGDWGSTLDSWYDTHIYKFCKIIKGKHGYILWVNKIFG